MLRLIGNCSNKNNYAYTEDEVTAVFDSIEKNVTEAKQAYGIFDERKCQGDFRNSFESSCTWVSGFVRNVFRFGDKPAYIYPGEGKTETYRQLNNNVNRCANALSKYGRGTRVMYCFRNSPEFIYVYIACQKIGAVGCPIALNASSAEIAAMIDESKPCVFIYEFNGGTELALNMARYKPELLLVKGYPRDKKMLEGHIRFDDYIGEFPNDEPQEMLSIYDVSTHFYTSGTTGRPKCVPVTGINEVMSVHEMVMTLNVGSNDIMMNASPWYHRGGLHCCGPNTVFYVGGTAVIMKEFDAAKCLEYIERYKITFLSSMPRALGILSSAQELNNRNLASLKGIITMGSIFEKDESERCRRILGRNIFNIYGTTESFFNTVLIPEDMTYMPGSVGKACIGDDVRIVKLYDKRRAEPDDIVARNGDEVGEIIICAPAKTAGFYYGNRAETEVKFYKGYLYTGDLGVWDEKGFISIAGRRDDMIICGGKKIYPAYIEEALRGHPKIEDCIVTSVSDGRGEKLTAYVVKADESLTADELDKYCRESPVFSSYNRPVYYRFKKTIQRNAAGKKLHSLVKKAAAADFKKGRLIPAKQRIVDNG